MAYGGGGGGSGGGSGSGGGTTGGTAGGQGGSRAFKRFGMGGSRGWNCMGLHPTGNYCNIEYLSISTTGNASDFGDSLYAVYGACFEIEMHSVNDV